MAPVYSEGYRIGTTASQQVNVWTPYLSENDLTAAVCVAEHPQFRELSSPQVTAQGPHKGHAVTGISGKSKGMFSYQISGDFPVQMQLTSQGSFLTKAKSPNGTLTRTTISSFEDKRGVVN